MATFRSFNWDTSLSYINKKGHHDIYEFTETNIFYGRNGSGKTTLSRILRALETGRLSDKYSSPEFCIELDKPPKLTQANLNSHNHCIRVFNEDFVNENLKFFIDENADISSFAVLGDDNARVEMQISQLENEIGNKEQGTGLYGILNQAEKALIEAESNFTKSNEDLDNLLENKSNHKGNGIRNNVKLFGDQNYNKRKLERDINLVKQNNYILSDEEQSDLKTIIKEESKNNITSISSLRFNNLSLCQQTQEFVEKTITIPEPIQDLLNDNLLENWVRQGITLNKSRETCAFCQSPISTNLWDKLSKHFNQESENLRSDITLLINNINQQKKSVEIIKLPEKALFYSEFHKRFDEIYNSLEDHKNAYISSLDKLIEQLAKRLDDITHNFRYTEVLFNQYDFEKIFADLNVLIDYSNDYTNELSIKQSQAQEKLRLNEVAKFINDIQYDDKKRNIEDLKIFKREKEQEKSQKLEIIRTKQREIESLKLKLNDEQKGAETVNNFLTHFLTGQNLCLKAIKDEYSPEKKVKFEIFRNNEKAHNLSEGERSLIAFCYFIAKLSDLSTQGKKPIIFIDDPICSLDSNHIFFIFSLIKGELFQKMKEDQLCSQLFISTHNLDFFKYLKSFKKTKIAYFLIEKEYILSQIKPMPEYLEKYATEFNYLFKNIYECANTTSWNDENYHILYNFGNNARKFLEIYIYYQYPIVAQNIDERLSKFFGQGNIPAFLNRINNEYSHLDGILERGSLPIEYAEAQLCAKAILTQIKNKNPEQFQALQESIGINTNNP